MTRRGFLRIGGVLGTLLTCAPLLGLLGMLVGITRVFYAWGKSGIDDSHTLKTEHLTARPPLHF